ncbi:MAG: ATP-dependent helicase HrpB [Proteobacteria bacterium]|nr:ATP-dependent helicase HrpB [Pseudomonadota bacterium]
MIPENIDLPIIPIIPEIRRLLSEHPNVVLQAPPGAGKTTLVPLALLGEPWLEGLKIIMLEPRRLAARAAAMRMADMMGEGAGETVGYRTRMDSKVGPKTRIEVLTEGILTRFLQRDPSLEGVGLIIFDEFHERSIHADLGLALSLESQLALREDLKILVMSATLEGKAVAELLGDAPLISSEGRSFPVETRFDPAVGWKGLAKDAYSIIPKVVAKVRQAMKEERGDILVFLPGAGEIRRVEAGLKESGLPEDILICPLYGMLSKKAQEEAILPSPQNKRKIVLATSIAETSLTIEGIRIVIDSGLTRVSKFSPGSGMSRLETAQVTRASADQRRGRAGRLEDGICCRLWPEGEILKSQNTPEILEADLSSLALELALWGVKSPEDLKWLDLPPGAAMSHARELLKLLEAIDDMGNITGYGKELAGAPLHPRLAHMVLKGRELGLASLACDLAAILSERDMLRCERGFNDADVRLRVDFLRKSGSSAPPGMSLDKGACRRIRQLADQLKNRLKVAPEAREADDSDQAGLLLAFAYPDRIAKKRPGSAGAYLLAGGKGARIAEYEPLAREEYLVVASLDGEVKEARFFLAASISLDEIEAHFAHLIVEEECIGWDSSRHSVLARKERRLGSILIAEEPILKLGTGEIMWAMLEGIGQAGIQSLPWNKKTRSLQSRAVFLHRLKPDFPDLSDDALLKNVESWLAPWLGEITRLDHLVRLDLMAALKSMLSYEEQQTLNRLAPTHISVPSGSRIPIDYESSDKPLLAVRLQEMFGLDQTPAIAGGNVKLTLHLLSPANRPIQVTEDLAGFWQKTYFDVKKDLKGRYPKHYWPDDPLQAKPTNRAKRRKP